MKWKIVALLASLLALPAMAADDYKTIDWDVLIPQGEKIQPPPPINHDGNFASVPQPVGGVNKKLDEQNVRLPGFVVPLEGDAKKITAFLLVPYFGACIHVPPPPPNQIIYVTGASNLRADMIYSPFWISGTITTDSVSHDLANAAYSIKADKVEEYTW